MPQLKKLKTQLIHDKIRILNERNNTKFVSNYFNLNNYTYFYQTVIFFHIVDIQENFLNYISLVFF